MKIKIGTSICVLLLILIVFSSTAAFASLGNYFDGWSESYWEYNSEYNFNVFYKRAVGTTSGYVGRHYLRCWVTNYGNTDTGRVYRNYGFTLRSPYAQQIHFPPVGVARAVYGT